MTKKTTKKKTANKKEVKKIQIKQDKKIRKSDAIKLHTYINRYEKLTKKMYKLTQFQEPLLFLKRRDRTVELYENATAGRFEYTHSDGTERTITLTPQALYRHRYADKDFVAYDCHEDYPFPSPINENPLLTVQQYDTEMTRALRESGYDELEKMDIKLAIANNWKWLVPIAVLSVVGGLLIYQFLSPATNGGGSEAVKQIINTTKDTVVTVVDATTGAVGGSLNGVSGVLNGFILAPIGLINKIRRKTKKK